MEKEVRNIKFSEMLLNVDKVYYFNYSEIGRPPTMSVIEVEIRYYYFELPSRRISYVFNVFLKDEKKSRIIKNNKETEIDFRLHVKLIIKKKFNFENIFKKELIIINII